MKPLTAGRSSTMPLPTADDSGRSATKRGSCTDTPARWAVAAAAGVRFAASAAAALTRRAAWSTFQAHWWTHSSSCSVQHEATCSRCPARYAFAQVGICGLECKAPLRHLPVLDSNMPSDAVTTTGIIHLGMQRHDRELRRAGEAAAQARTERIVKGQQEGHGIHALHLRGAV
jgi:hypothetical protein